MELPAWMAEAAWPDSDVPQAVRRPPPLPAPPRPHAHSSFLAVLAPSFEGPRSSPGRDNVRSVHQPPPSKRRVGLGADVSAHAIRRWSIALVVIPGTFLTTGLPVLCVCRNFAQYAAVGGLLLFASFWLYLLLMAMTTEHGDGGHLDEGRTGRRLASYILG